MNQESFKYNIFSNSPNGDDFFIPGDKVWDKIDAELGTEEKDRKPFIFLLFFGIALFLIGSVFLTSDRSFFKESNYSQLIEDKPQPNHASNEIIATASDTNNQKSLASSDQSTKDDQSSQTNENEINKSNHPKNQKPGLRSKTNLISSSAKVSQGISTNKTASDTQSTLPVNQNNNTIFNEEGFGIKREQNSLSSAGEILIPVRQEFATQSNESPGISENQQAASVLNSVLSKQPGELTINPLSKPLATTAIPSIILNPLPLNAYAISYETAINHSYWSNKMVLIDQVRQTARNSWIVELHGYASSSSYAIKDFSGFSAVDFTLTGDLSNGAQVLLKRQVSNRWSIGLGLGVDNAHFNADYGISISPDELSVSEAGTRFQASVSKNLPSLAGGLDTRFNLIGLSANLTTRDIQLNLAHNYRTITVPLLVEYSIMQSNGFQLKLGTGFIFSKRLLAIDTGVNSLHADSNEEEIELADIAALEVNDQPFRLYNASNTLSLVLEYAVAKSLSLGIRSTLARPLFNIYEDQNYSVRSHQYQLGVSLNYTLKGKRRHLN